MITNTNLLLGLCLGLTAQDPGVGPPQDPRAQPMPIPSTAVFRRGETRIVVDGSIQEWPALPAIALDDLRQVSGTALQAYRGPEDVSGVVFVIWDELDLYVAARIRDDWHIRLAKDSPRIDEIPPADSLMITLDPGRNTRAIGADRGRHDDAEFWLAEVEGQGDLVVRWDRFRGTARFAVDAAAVVKHDESERITTIEARLPWKEILAHGQEPEPNSVIDLQLVINDYDDPSDPMPQTRVGWTFGMGPRIDPGLLGSAILVDLSPAAITSSMRLPKPPPPPVPDEPAVLDSGHWIDLYRRLRQAAPSVVSAATMDPLLAGGVDRANVLRELEQHVSAFPRVDFLEFQQRIHRRMSRECAGIVAKGLPFFWDYVLDQLRRELVASPPDGGFRLFHLPQGGFVVRSGTATFAIDPAGYRVEKALPDLVDFVLLTEPLETAKRNDQLILRLLSTEPRRPVFTQLALPIPGIDATEIPVVVPGITYSPGGLQVTVIGHLGEGGAVSRALGYSVQWPDGTTMIISGPSILEGVTPLPEEPDMLILSPLQPDAAEICRRIRARRTVLAGTLECAAHPGIGGRVTLDDAIRLQLDIRPLESTILAPGEHLDSTTRGR